MKVLYEYNNQIVKRTTEVENQLSKIKTYERNFQELNKRLNYEEKDRKEIERKVKENEQSQKVQFHYITDRIVALEKDSDFLKNETMERDNQMQKVYHDIAKAKENMVNDIGLHKEST